MASLLGSRQSALESLRLCTCGDILYASRTMALNMSDLTYRDSLQLGSRYAVVGRLILFTPNPMICKLFIPIGILRPNLLHVMKKPDM